MNTEEIIKLILSRRRDISREEILQKIMEKKLVAGGFLTDETAARLVASELGLEVTQESFHLQEIPISDLVAGLNDVTVTGRVLIVYPIRTYKRKNGTEGQISHLLIADKSGTLPLLLWNDKAELVKNSKLKPEQIIRILHGYIREARNGQLELHLGNRGEIQISPPDVEEDKYPHIECFMEKIGKITGKQKKANIIGVVQNFSKVSVFQRSDGAEGKTVRATLKDATGSITTVFWNEKVGMLADIQVGDRLQIIDARVKERVDGRIELHVDNKSFVEKLLPQKEEFAKISSLTKEGGPVAVRGIVKTKPTKREVTTSKGEKIMVTTFELEDDTGRIWVSAWRKHAETTSQLSIGAEIKIKNAYVRKGFADALEITTRSSTQMELITK